LGRERSLHGKSVRRSLQPLRCWRNPAKCGEGDLQEAGHDLFRGGPRERGVDDDHRRGRRACRSSLFSRLPHCFAE
jgi:hypothetical protein